MKIDILKIIFVIILNTIIEFLPISSTFHTIILARILNINEDLNLLLSFSQLAISFYICFYFKNDIIFILKKIFNKKNFLFYFNVCISTVPTVIFGLLFYKKIKSFYSNNITFILLIIGGFFMLFTEKFIENKKKYKEINKMQNITFKSALKIGLFQCLSLIPAISRSASTICGGLISNLSRETAVKYSFFISIPVSIGASLFDIYKNINYINSNNYSVLILCFLTSFITSSIFCKKLLKYLENNKLNYFAIYRIIIGFICLLFF